VRCPEGRGYDGRMSTHGKRRRGGGRFTRRLADILLIAGGLLLAYPFWSAGYAQVQQARLGSAYDKQAAAFAATAVAKPVRGMSENERVMRAAVAYGRTLRPGDPIGRIKIARIGLDRIVQQGVRGQAALDPDGDAALLRNGPVHYGISSLPGAGEPFAVAGHRTTYGAPFNKLDKLRRGDAIVVETPYGRFSYSVVKTTVVLPDDVGVLRDRGYALVLTTCTPLYSASHRLVVWAKLDFSKPPGR